MSPTAPAKDTSSAKTPSALIAEGVSLRGETDLLIQGWMSYLPPIAVACGLLVLLVMVLLVPGWGGWMLAYVLMYATGFALLAVLNYKLAKRLVGHCHREDLLRQGLILRQERGGGRADEHLAEMRRLYTEEREGRRLPSLLLAPMSALPLVGLAFGFYYLRPLTVVPAEHDRAWVAFMAQYSQAAAASGATPPPVPGPTIPGRSFALWAVASLLAFPVLGLWYHLLVRDMNHHLKAQWPIEDSL